MFASSTKAEKSVLSRLIQFAGNGKPSLLVDTVPASVIAESRSPKAAAITAVWKESGTSALSVLLSVTMAAESYWSGRKVYWDPVREIILDHPPASTAA